jgi:O-antigen/teichoic acid export membrane protein
MKNISELVRNASWNLLGFGVPVIVAIFAIPLLIRGLGVERFGVLTIGWVIMGYFAMLDLGMGQTTTKFIAVSVARRDVEGLPTIVWSSFAAHIALGVFGAGVFALLVPWLSSRALHVRAELQPEVGSSFYVLAASIPLVVGGTCLRGVLEGVRRFDLVNRVKIPAGMINYVGPVVVLQFTKHLVYVIGVIALSRGVVLAIYLLLCIRTLPHVGSRFRVQSDVIKPLLTFGGWVAVSSLTLPLIASLDRFVIGSVVSMTAVAYYATPYEVVTKLWILSGSLLSALFPVFSALSVNRGEEVRPLGARALKYLLVMAVPAVAFLVTFSRELLSIWIDPDFARHSSSVLRWLAAGVLVSVLAQVPFTMLQGWGRADVPAKLQLVQLPLYALAAYYLAQTHGVTGVAIGWMARAGLEFALLTVAADMLLPRAAGVRWFRRNAVVVILALLTAFWVLGSGITMNFAAKLGISIPLFAALAAAEWFVVLDPHERQKVANMLGGTGATANGD